MAHPSTSTPRPARPPVRRGTAIVRRAALLTVAIAACFGPCRAAVAAPSQAEVFRSIQDSVGGNGGGAGSSTDIDGITLLMILGGVVALIVILSLFNRQKSRPTAPAKARNHHGKLIREVLKAIPIKSKELKQLKVIAEQVEAAGPAAGPAPVSPLTLLLCPSVMARTIQQGNGKRVKFDRRALASVARKAGLQVAKR